MLILVSTYPVVRLQVRLSLVSLVSWGCLMYLWCLSKIHSYFIFTCTNTKFREGNSTPFEHSCLENPMDRGAWWAAVHGVAKSRTRLSKFPFTFMHWRRKWQPTPVSLPGDSQGRGSLVGCCLWGCTESDTTEATEQQ